MKKITAIGIITILLVSFALFTTTSASPDWYDTDFSYRKQIDISHINASGNTLTNYPAFINVSKEPSMQSDFDDIRFIDSSDNLMAFELENYTASYGLYWVNITSLPNTGQTIWLYYGNNTATSAANPTAVWDSSAKMVQHLNNMNDSTSYDNDAINNNADYTASGKIDGAYDFDGSTSYLNCGNDPFLNITDAITIEAWVNFNSFDSNPCILSRKPGSYEQYWWDIRDGGTSWMHGSYTNVGGACWDETAYVFETDKWYQLVWTYNKVRSIGYINGVEESNIGKTCTPNSGIADLYIGRRGDKSQFSNGTIDEVRIYDRALSADEINQSYQLATNQSSFVTWGSAERNYVNPPINLQNTIGNFWINYTWQANQSGDALYTDSFNTSYWVNAIHHWDNSTNTSRNESVGGGGWLNISVYAYNTSTGKLSGAVSDQQQVAQLYRISGYIKDIGGNSIPNAYVYDNQSTDSDYTISSGYYVLEGFANGSYEITASASASAYIDNSIIVTVSGINLTNQNITLTASGISVGITVWYNNYTSDNSTNFTILYTDNRTVFFNVSANQIIDYWVWYVDDALYQNSSSNNITKTWDEGGNKTISVYGVNVNGKTNTLTWNVEIEYTIYEYAKLIYNQNLLLIEAEKMLAQMWIFLVLLLIDFSMILFFFANTRNRIYGNVAVGLLSVFLTFILAHRALLYPVEMPDLSLFLNGIALVMMVFTILVIIEIVIEKMQKSVS